MREIKFRGMNDVGKWFFGFLYIDEITGNAFIDTTRWQREPVRLETVGQYIGLEDKQGHAIYKGDILSVTCETFYLMSGKKTGRFKTTISEVVWSDKISGFCQRTNNFTSGFAMSKNLIEKFEEIIGNIHEDNELLKGGE